MKAKNTGFNFSFKDFVYGEQSLFEWILKNSDENGLQKTLPDNESLALNTPQLSEFRFVDGMLDGIVAEEDLNSAKILYELFLEFANTEFDDTNDDLIDFYLGKIYKYIIEHRTISYIDAFVSLLFEQEENDSTKRLLKFCLFVSKYFLTHAIHREAVKFALAVFALFTFEDEDLQKYLVFGRAEEFAKFVAVALKRQGYNKKVFELAKLTKGWGRIAYIEYLEIENEEMQKWLLFEGYKCDIGIDHIVIECLEKGDLLGFIKTYGFDEKLYKASGEMINALSEDFSKAHFEDYKHSKELVYLFVKESKNQKMNLKNFAILCDLIPYIKSETFNLKEQEELLDIIRFIAFHKGIDWKSFIEDNPLDYNARIIAKHLGIDLFEKIFNKAFNDKNFDEWYVLSSSTKDKSNYKKICELAKQRFDLDSMKKEPQDELGLGSEFSAYNNLEFIVQFLRSFDEIIGLELVETLLQSPVVRSRNMALNVIEHWQKNNLQIPSVIFELIQKNQTKEPNEGVLKRYEEFLKNYQNSVFMSKYKNSYEWYLQVFPEYSSSGIWTIYDKKEQKKHFKNIDYELLKLPQSLELEFKAWQDLYDSYGLAWFAKDANFVQENMAKAFEQTKLELAKKLKIFFKEKAYVETFIDEQMKEIKYYSIIDDYEPLCDEDGASICLDDLKEELGLLAHKKELELLMQELEEWGLKCCEEKDEQFDKEGVCKGISQETYQQGRNLSEKMKNFLPKHCCLEYFADRV